MKRLILFLALCLIAVSLSSCAFDKYTLVQIRGEDVKVPFGSITPFEGKGIKGTLLRRVFWSDEKGRQPAPIDKTGITEGADSSGSIEVNK